MGFVVPQLSDAHHYWKIPKLLDLGLFLFIRLHNSFLWGILLDLKKSTLEPAKAVRFLGYICNSERQAFILPEDKHTKFLLLRETILENKTVSLKKLQKFAGKTTSFALLVPAAKLYTNSVYQAISKACKSGQTKIRLTKDLRLEITHWRFLDTWDAS